MATSDEEIQHECWFVGTHDKSSPQYADRKPTSPNAGLVQIIALEILNGRKGKYHPTTHFREQMESREFDLFEMEYVIRNGSCVQGGEFCEEYRNHKYTFRGNIDGVDFDAVFALSADHDFIRSPLMILITGCFKTKSGRRGKAY